MRQTLPSPGETFEGKYRIEAHLGSGGFSQVFRAREIGGLRKVAIKILYPDGAGAEQSRHHELFARRFEQEARLVSNLRSPHTVRVHEFNRSESGLLYLVMEYLDGERISRLVRKEGPIEPERVVGFLRQAINSLEEAHLQGILHRDIKPGNLMLCTGRFGTELIKVLDFGLAEPRTGRGALRKHEIDEGLLVGTPRYMSPEQIRGEPLTEASDVYSLGLTAYEMLTGEKPLEADDTDELIELHLRPDPVRLPATLDIPGGLRTVIDGMMEKSLGTRIHSAAAVRTGLEEWDVDVTDAERRADDPTHVFDRPSTREMKQVLGRDWSWGRND